MTRQDIYEDISAALVGLRFSAENLCSGIDETDIVGVIESCSPEKTLLIEIRDLTSLALKLKKEIDNDK